MNAIVPALKTIEIVLYRIIVAAVFLDSSETIIAPNVRLIRIFISEENNDFPV